MQRLHRRSGLSLLESVMAIFIFVGGALACFQMALNAVRHSARVAEVTQATLIADSCVDRIREWAYSPNNYLGAWAIYDDQTFEWPDPSGYRVRTRVASDQRSPLSPCSTLSVGHPLRQLENSTRLVTVDVSWRTGGTGETVSLNALIGEPARPLRAVNPLVISRTGTVVDPIPIDGKTGFRGELFDANNQPIEGMLWSWSLLPDVNSGPPGAGSATILAIPSKARGEEIEVMHRFYNGDPETSSDFQTVPGWVIVRASCFYDGAALEAEFAPIQLAEP